MTTTTLPAIALAMLLTVLAAVACLELSRSGWIDSPAARAVWRDVARLEQGMER